MTTRLLTPQNVCLQIIDVQQSLMAKIHEAATVSETVELMVRCAEILGIPVVANTQYVKGLGPYVPELEPLVAGIDRFDKVEFNALANAETAAFIEKLPESVTTVALVGVETHICIYQTAMGLLDKGYKVWVVSDGVSSRKVQDHQDGLARMRDMGVAIGPSEMLIYEMLGRAGSGDFKKVLPFIIARER